MAQTVTITLPDDEAEEHFEAARTAFNRVVLEMISELDYTTKYQDEVLTALADSLYSGTFISPSAEALAAAREYDEDEG